MVSLALSLSLSSSVLRKSIDRASGRCAFSNTITVVLANKNNATATPIQLHTEWIAPAASRKGHDENELKGNDTDKGKDEHYTILFMHGLLGSGRNLKTFARKVVQQQSSNRGSCRGGILMDLRGHGSSFQTQKREEHGKILGDVGNDIDNNNNNKYGSASTFQDCAQDIKYTLQEFQNTDTQQKQQQALPPTATTTTTTTPPTQVFVGHSFGGRLALEYAASVAKIQPLKALWLLDTVPGQANESVDRVLATITNVLNDSSSSKSSKSKPLTKKEIVSVLTAPPHEMDLPTAQWLAMSYDEKSGDNFGFDNDFVTRLKPEFEQQDFTGLLREILDAEAPTTAAAATANKKTQVHVVRGGKNIGWSIPILSELEKVRKEFPTNFHLHVLPSAGHNVHVDDLQGLVKLFAGR